MLKAAYQVQQQFFRQRAEHWHFPDGDRELLSRLLPLMPVKRGAVILDVGCGTGQIGSWLCTQLPHVKVIGIDMCLAMLQAGRRIGPTQFPGFVQAFAEQLPLRSASCDLILNYCVFPHLKARNLAVNEYKRVLKPGGSVLVIHPGGRRQTHQKHQEIGFPVAQDRLPPNVEILTLFENAGFRGIKLIDTEEVFYLELQSV